MIPTLLRLAEHKALETLTLEGSILDLGGSKDAEYLKNIKGTHAVTVVNMDPKTRPDIVHDLEKVLPMKDASYDHVLLINVLEHIYEYRQLLGEASRVVKKGGSVTIVVPFLFPIHPSPHDYWRFTQEALEKECANASLQVKTITPLGTGVFAARFVMLDRLLPFPLRALLLLFRPVIFIADILFAWSARLLGKKYDPSDYALGFLVSALRT